jgi:hypothetical protein
LNHKSVVVSKLVFNSIIALFLFTGDTHQITVLSITT